MTLSLLDPPHRWVLAAHLDTHLKGTCVACSAEPTTARRRAAERCITQMTDPAGMAAPPARINRGYVATVWDALRSQPVDMLPVSLRTLLTESPALLASVLLYEGVGVLALLLAAFRAEEIPQVHAAARELLSHVPAQLLRAGVPFEDGAWLLAELAGLLPAAALRTELPVRLLLVPGFPGFGTCRSVHVIDAYRSLNPNEQEVFTLLLEEWRGPLADLTAAATSL